MTTTRGSALSRAYWRKFYEEDARKRIRAAEDVARRHVSVEVAQLRAIIDNPPAPPDPYAGYADSLHPAITGMLALIPSWGSEWPEEKRREWCAAMKHVLGMVYVEPPEDARDYAAPTNDALEGAGDSRSETNQTAPSPPPQIPAPEKDQQHE